MTTPTENSERIGLIYNMLLIGYTRFQIIKYIKTQTDWKKSEASIDKYIRAARDILSKQAEEYKDSQFDLALNRMEDLYNKALKENKLREALEIQKEKNKILGIYQPTKSEITIKKEIKEMTDEELLAIINSEE